MPQGATTPQEVLRHEVNKVEASKSPLAAEKTYKIASGDSLYAIAKKFYGDGTLWKKLAAANAGRVGDNGSVRVGSSITIPAKEELTGKVDARVASKSDVNPGVKAEQKASKPETGKAKSYQVRPGDTLMNIARQQLGSASRSGEIASMNKMDPDDDLLAGAILKLPSH